MILNQNISTIHVFCVGCTVEPARRFFSARRSQLQTLARSSHGGETGERGLALVGRCCCCSSCKVPFFHTGKGRSHPNTSLNMDKAVRWDVARSSGKRVLWTSVTVALVRTGLIGPLGLDLSLPTGGMTLVRSRGAAGRAASVSRQPLVWSRDQNSRHVTTYRAAGAHQTAPQSSLLHLHSSRLTTQNCATEISGLQKAVRRLPRPLPTSIWSKNVHLFHVGPDAALQLGWGAM